MAGEEVYIRRRRHTAVPNQTLFDSDLSFQAVSILLVSLAMPPGAPMGYRAFVDMKRGMGEDAVRKALRLLGELGYRWQFRVRVKGTFRTITVIADERISENDALAEVEARGGYDFLIDCPTTGTNYAPSKEEETSIEAVSAGHTTQGFPRHGEMEGLTMPGKTTARSTTARQTTAPSRREVINSSLRSELISFPDQTRMREDIAVEESGIPVRSGQVEASDQDLVAAVDAARPAADAVSESSTATTVVDRGLISECLPASMQALDAQGAIRVSNLLRERVDAGWKPSDIRVLMDRPLPEKVHRLSALVAKRLETNVEPALAPVEAMPVARVQAVEQVPDPAETAWGQVFYAPVWEAAVVAADGNYLAAMKATQACLDEAYPTREEYARAWRTIADGRGETIPDAWWAAHPEELTTRAIEVGDEAIRNRREGAA